ncbi:PREDICTED: protein timeless homolog, partial [Chaetura pelagica]|uniref:protein timeless homolog n=1 Tax=Chaetura pelagica TaxID=8897 RepID=UPI0005231D58
LMVNLTQPALLCFGKVPPDATSRHHFLQVLSYLQAYKEAFASEKVFVVLSEKLYDLLQLDWEQRQEEDTLLIERILLLVRNVLHVPPDPAEQQGVDGDASVHDRVLWALHISGMDDLLKFLASAQAEQQWALHVLEIISLMFRDQSPEELAALGQGRAAIDGSYLLQGLKAIGDRDVVFHKGLHNLKSYSHDLGKEPRRVPRRRQVAPEAETPHRSARNVRLFLCHFCQDFLESCYNRLMLQVKDQLVREKAQQHDETYYLWATAFFMAFNRRRGFRPELVSETVGVRAFHFIEQNLTTYYEMAQMDKKEATTWAHRMHLALKAYQELLRTVQEMDRSPEQAVRDSSQVIKSNIFYLMEYRELFLALFPPDAVELEELWAGLAPQLQACLQGQVSLPEDVVPFDAASETPVEEQRAEALLQIQGCLRDGRVPQALQLLRSARDIWPEGDVFGPIEAGPDEETRLLQEILFAALPRPHHCPTTGPEAEEPEEEEEEDEEEEEETVQVSEKQFNFLDYLKRFACAPVVRALVLLLRGYNRNSPRTNHCAARLLHRLARDLRMEAMPAQDSSAEDGDSEEEEKEEDEADEDSMEEPWVPEEGTGQGLAHRLHEEGLAGPLQWLQNCLRRTAGDREEDGEQAGGAGQGVSVGQIWTPGFPWCGAHGANPCPYCRSEDPVPVPIPSLGPLGTKRRRELESEDENSRSSSAEPAPEAPQSWEDEDEDPQPLVRRKRIRCLEEDED